MSETERRTRITRASMLRLARVMAAHKKALAVGFSGLILVTWFSCSCRGSLRRPWTRWPGHGDASLSVVAGRRPGRRFGCHGGVPLRLEILPDRNEPPDRADLRRDFYAHLQRLSPQFFDRTKVGTLMAHATNDISAVRMATGFAALASLDALVLAVASLSIMLAIDTRLTLLTLLPLPFLTLLMLLFGRTIHRRFTRVQEAFAALTERAQENFSGIRVVKSYGDEVSEERYFGERAQALRRPEHPPGQGLGVLRPRHHRPGHGEHRDPAGGRGRRVIRGEISLGQFVAFSGYLNLLIWPMLAVGWVANMFTRGLASLERLQTLMETEPDVRDGAITRLPRPALAVKNLTFAYPGTEETALRGISFELAPGHVLGIMGRTGSGKTTLVEALMRLYDPPRGTVFLDGIDVLDLTVSNVRSLYSYVPQETFLFAMSIAENISFGMESLPPEEIHRLRSLYKWMRRSARFLKPMTPWWGSAASPFRGAEAADFPCSSPGGPGEDPGAG